MKVAVDLIKNKIIDILPDSATESHKFLQLNNYKLLDVDNPYTDDGTTFRDLLDVDLLPIKANQWKGQRQVLVDNIEVTYNDVVYQGDETSQDRMSRAINGLPDDTSTVYWKAKDNSKQKLNKMQLKEILYLAGQEQTRIWFNEPTV